MSVAGQRKGSDRNRIKANEFAASVLPVIRELQANGVTSYRAIALELERQGIRTARGGDWTQVQVINILKRTKAL
jgi:recombinase